MAYRHRTTGFTLVEVLVAITLLSLLAAGIVTTFRYGQRAYARLSEHRRGDLDVVTTQRFVRQALESTYPFALGIGQTRFGLEGEPTAVEFTAQSPRAVDVGHYRYSIYLRSRQDHYFDLIVRSDVDRHGFADERRAAAREEVLLERVASARWSYLASSGSGAGRPEWQTQWAQRKPPALIRLEIDFPGDDSRIWPELLVATLITEDAQCEFDVVAQACREGT